MTQVADSSWIEFLRHLTSNVWIDINEAVSFEYWLHIDMQLAEQTDTRASRRYDQKNDP